MPPVSCVPPTGALPFCLWSVVGGWRHRQFVASSRVTHPDQWECFNASVCLSIVCTLPVVLCRGAILLWSACAGTDFLRRTCLQPLHEIGAPNLWNSSDWLRWMCAMTSVQKTSFLNSTIQDPKKFLILYLHQRLCTVHWTERLNSPSGWMSPSIWKLSRLQMHGLNGLSGCMSLRTWKLSRLYIAHIA